MHAARPESNARRSTNFRLSLVPGDGRQRARTPLALILGMSLLAGCRDAPMDPLVSLVTPETAAAVDVPLALPDLADLVQRTGIATPAADWVELWQASWTQPAGARDGSGAGTDFGVDGPGPGLGDEPELIREEAVRRVAPLLADSLGLGGVSSALAPLLRIEQDLGSLSDAPGDLLPSILAVRSRIDEARQALAAGQAIRALEAGLTASDQLRSIGPTAIARTLIARADRALMATVGANTVDELSVSRGERMLDGARRALADDEVERAVQRAFYAVQLLEQARVSRREVLVDTIG